MQTESSHLITAKLKDLRPTQITVGMAEVAAKIEKWKQFDGAEREAYLSDHWFPAVIGPRGNHYITDHHHLGLALIESHVKTVRLVVLKDLSSLHIKEFWMAMDHHDWVHPYNAKGHRDEFSAIPKKLTSLVDDPYRSLADQVEKLGGYAKTDLPYVEFLWADYFRHRIDLKSQPPAWSKALVEALVLAKDHGAKNLPGWCGVSGG